MAQKYSQGIWEKETTRACHKWRATYRCRLCKYCEIRSVICNGNVSPKRERIKFHKVERFRGARLTIVVIKIKLRYIGKKIRVWSARGGLRRVKGNYFPTASRRSRAFIILRSEDLLRETIIDEGRCRLDSAKLGKRAARGEFGPGPVYRAGTTSGNQA